MILESCHEEYLILNSGAPEIPLPSPGLEGEEVAPRAGVFIEAMRDIGYSLESAVADIIDNSIAANASQVDLRFGWDHLGQPWFAVLDNGTGMTELDLVEAMRPGTRSPLATRDPKDLGRFGLGLKTASFSQCRRLTVVTRKEGDAIARCWDLDRVRATDQWKLIRPSKQDLEAIPVMEELAPTGTIVFWEQLDRLDLGSSGEHGQAILNEKVASIREHLALVFHRYLAGEPGEQKVSIRINCQPIKPFDPFNSRHPSTTLLTVERFKINGETVEMHPYILPHHSKVTPAEYQGCAGGEGYLRSQGFYIYRNRRLIISGTWFRMARQEELTKLARIRIDIPNTLDYLWTIDVRKSRAHPPETVRQRMKVLMDKIRESAKRPYVHRGAVIAQRSAVAVWRRREFNQRVQYEVNPDHPILVDLRGDLPEEGRMQLDLALAMIGKCFPTALMFSEMAGHPERCDSESADSEFLERLASHLRACFPVEEKGEFRQRLRSMEPFASNQSFVDHFLDGLPEGE